MGDVDRRGHGGQSLRDRAEGPPLHDRRAGGRRGDGGAARHRARSPHRLPPQVAAATDAQLVQAARRCGDAACDGPDGAGSRGTVNAVAREPARIDLRTALDTVGPGWPPPRAPACHRATETVLNRPIGSQRRFDWLALELDIVKTVGRKLGGSVNDVVLAVPSASGLRRYFLQHGDVAQPSSSDLTVRAMCPVNLPHGGRGLHRRQPRCGNVRRPPGRRARRRGARSRRPRRRPSGERAPSQSAGNRASRQHQRLDRAVPDEASSASTRRACVLYNAIVTNIPGSPVPLCTCRARGCSRPTPSSRSSRTRALALALFSYAGKHLLGLQRRPRGHPRPPRVRARRRGGIQGARRGRRGEDPRAHAGASGRGRTERQLAPAPRSARRVPATRAPAR